MSSIPNYSVEVQDLYLQMFLSNGDAYARCQNIFDHTHFDKRLANTAKFIKEYVDQYRSMPATETVNANCKTTYSPLNLDDDDYAWLLDTYEQFARHRALENAIVQSTDLLTKGDYNLVEKMIKDAVQISLNRDIGTDYFKSPKERLTALRDRNGIISTGWESVDRPLYGGLGRGTLTIFAAGSGGGKSLFLANLGINWAFQKLNVVYFTFELSEELVAMRLDAMTTGRGTKDIFRNIDDVDLKVKMLAKTSGHIQIKYMPSGKTCNDLRAYLKEYKVKTGVVPDIILVDYLDLMMPLGVKVSPSDMFIKDKYVSEELRNLASETGAVLVTAAQLNRCFLSSTPVNVNGKDIPIKDVVVGDQITSNTGLKTVTKVYPPIKQLTYKIRTKSGKELVCSAGHKFPTSNGLLSLETGLAVGSQLIVKQQSSN